MCRGESNNAKVIDDDASSRWEPVSKPWSYYLVLVLLLVLSPLILLFSLIYRIVYYCCLKKPVEETEVPDPYKDVRFKRCPVATWAPGFTGPIKSQAETRIREFGCATKAVRGVDKNDHNYGSELGQGNTLGFLAGHLIIDKDGINELKPAQRVGLFAKADHHSVVARLSDFGADGTLQLGRMALKLPCSDALADAWQSEINMHFTSDLSTFVMANFGSIRAGSNSHKEGIFMVPWGVRNMALYMPHVLSFGNHNLLARDYYSQLPYALGEGAVVKYRLKPLVRDAPLMSKTLTEIGTARASAFADGREATKCVVDLVGEKDVAFALQIQVRPVSGDRSERVYRDGASTWSEPYLTVGKLVFPQQTLNEAGVNTDLQSELCSHFKVGAASKEAKAMHKSFFFHPISTAEVHRPVGDINEYRCEYYARHAHARLAHMQECTGVAGHATFPFDEIKSNVSAFKREQP